jgi:glycosyltransferase involved in cell wall biosynthesis
MSHQNNSADPSGEFQSVCVITHPLGSAGENATRTLLEILSVITPVTLVTADLPMNSAIRDRHEVVEISENGIEQTDVFMSGFRFVLNQLRMCLAIIRRDEKVILFFGATAYLLPIICARLLGRTVILEPRGNVPLTLRLSWERQMPALLAQVLFNCVWTIERLGYHFANAIITYTPAMAEELQLNRFENKLYSTGARYIDVDRFTQYSSLEERNQVIGYLGRIDEEKGIRTLATAVELLPEDITFRFVGDGDLLPWLREQLSEEVETGKVEITGWVDHDRIPAELNRIRLLVMPSSPTEGLPTTILESLACGTPVYATPVSGIPDVINDGKTGFLMEESDPDHLCEDIVNILSRDDLAEIGANGRRLVNENYTLEAATNRYREILLDIKDNSV